ncbi:MAG: DUF2249 domain-containing protein [Gemmobacter sp.]
MTDADPSTIREYDARPLLREGREPFGEIMAAVDTLLPGQPLRVLASFRPVPLLTVMSNRGFSWRDRALPGGDWEVIFTPPDNKAAAPEPGIAPGSSSDAALWPDPVREFDLTDLAPPEPMVRILAALEDMAPGEVLFALLVREPVFLYPELALRGHEWAGNYDTQGTTFRIMVRRGPET